MIMELQQMLAAVTIDSFTLQIVDLSAVAYTGSYEDLLDVPERRTPYIRC